MAILKDLIYRPVIFMITCDDDIHITHQIGGLIYMSGRFAPSPSLKPDFVSTFPCTNAVEEALWETSYIDHIKIKFSQNI